MIGYILGILGFCLAWFGWALWLGPPDHTDLPPYIDF